MSNKILKYRRNYTTIDNTVFKDNNLSAKAKGLLVQMLSLPDNWDFSIVGLTRLFTDGQLSISSGLNELKARGYLKVVCVRDAKGKIADWVYIIKEDPSLDDTYHTTPELENTHLENKEQLNTNKLSTNKSNTNECSSTEYSPTSNDSAVSNSDENIENIFETNVSPIFSVETKKNHSKRFQKPTLQELSDYISENRFNVDPEKLFDYYEACGWTIGKNKPMKDWKAAVRTWVRNNKEWNDNKQYTAHSDNPIDKYGGHNPSIDRTFGPGDEIPF